MGFACSYIGFFGDEYITSKSACIVIGIITLELAWCVWGEVEGWGGWSEIVGEILRY